MCFVLGSMFFAICCLQKRLNLVHLFVHIHSIQNSYLLYDWTRLRLIFVLVFYFILIAVVWGVIVLCDDLFEGWKNPLCLDLTYFYLFRIIGLNFNLI